MFIGISCTNRNETDKTTTDNCDDYIQINNKTLEKEIVAYRNFIMSDFPLKKGDSIYVGVFVKNIDDSINRYIITPIDDQYFFKAFPPHLICKVQGHDTFFTFTAGYSYDDKNAVFRLKPDSFWKLTKKYFPKAYKTYKKKGYFGGFRIYEPKECYLTFINDSLINKTYEVGTSVNKIKVKINGKEKYL